MILQQHWMRVCVCACVQPGGEMYFSDIYSNQAIPEVLRKNKVLWGESH